MLDRESAGLRPRLPSAGLVEARNSINGRQGRVVELLEMAVHNLSRVRPNTGTPGERMKEPRLPLRPLQSAHAGPPSVWAVTPADDARSLQSAPHQRRFSPPEKGGVL